MILIADRLTLLARSNLRCGRGRRAVWANPKCQLRWWYIGIFKPAGAHFGPQHDVRPTPALYGRPHVSADLMTSRSQRHRRSRPMPCARQRRFERHAERPTLSIPAAGRLREFRAANRHSTACQTSGRGRFIRQSLGLMTIIAGLATVSGISHIVACLTVSPRERRATDRDRKIKANWRLRPSSTASDCLHVCFECCKRHHWRRRNVLLTETRKSFSAIARCAVFRACAARPAAQSAAHEHYR